MNRAVRKAVADRADGKCEACHASLFREWGHLDHFFGRGRIKESVSNCWFLCPPCDRKKTNNEPDAETWLSRFVEHCKRHEYEAEGERATRRLAFVMARREADRLLKRARALAGGVA